MADRDTTKRMFTHMINMMEQHDTMTISCGDPLMELLKEVRELLKEQEAVVKQWTKEIADNQLAHAPKDSHEFMSLDEHLENEYKRGIWDGLQIAWNIISEGR